MDLTQIWNIRKPISLVATTFGVNNLTRIMETEGGSYVLRVYKAGTDLSKVQFELEVLRGVARQELSFAVPAPIPTRDGELLARFPAEWVAELTAGTDAVPADGDALATLVRVIPGARPEWANHAHAFARGRALGELISALARVDAAPPPLVTTYGDLAHQQPEVPDPLAACRRAPVRPELQEPLARFMERTIAAVPGLYATLPLQLIHGDFVTVNLLLAEDRITGVLDFEFTCRDLRPMDLASALPIPFNEDEATDWDLIDALGRGYVSCQALTLAEAEALPDVLRLRRAGTFVHMAGQYWAGKGREDLIHYGSRSAVQVEAWLERNGAELVRRAQAWAKD